MSNQQQIDYQRIEQAIHYIRRHFKEQPSLDDIARAVNVSSYHFQRMFKEWAGVSPKKFMQYISLGYARRLLKERASLMDAAYETGLSGTSRLHDLFVSIEGMTPGEFKQGGAGLSIHYSFAQSPFGKLIVASTAKGICHMHFEDDETQALKTLQARFPNASYLPTIDRRQQEALLIFQKDWSKLNEIKLHLAASPFQLKVWESLITIPMGMLSTYSDIAEKIGKPKAARAVGSAIASNPIAFLIPCHRVIQNNGKISGYRWGTDKKTAIIGWEAAQSTLTLQDEQTPL